MTLHFSQMGLTDALTFMTLDSCGRQASSDSRPQDTDQPALFPHPHYRGTLATHELSSEESHENLRSYRIRYGSRRLALMGARIKPDILTTRKSESRRNIRELQMFDPKTKTPTSLNVAMRIAAILLRR